MLLSSALQNYANNYPIIIRTKRYNRFPLLGQTELSYVFFKDHILMFTRARLYNQLSLTINQLFTLHFRSKFWLLWKGLTSKNSGLISNNITRSASFWTLANTEQLFIKNKKHTIKFPPKQELSNIKYFQPIVALHYSFNKSFYNNLIFYWINLILSFQPVMITEFKLRYSFILLPSHFYLFTFLNLFYFRIHNY